MSLVLVADDEPAVLEVLSDVVEDLGHEVLRAHDGREALAAARQHLPQLVITDHMMPRLTGLDLCRQLRADALLKEVPTILLSAALPHGSPEANAFLPKPFELSEFERLVEATLAHGKPPPRGPASAPVYPDADHLIQSVAHEIRTPLAAARLNLQLLQRTLGEGKERADRGYLDALDEQLHAVDAMVASLLDASRLADGSLQLERRRVDLCELIHRWIAHQSARHPGLGLVLESSQPKLELTGDERRLTQILDSVLASAVRYGSPRGQLLLQVEAGEDGVTLKISALRVEDQRPDLPPSADREQHGHAVELYLAAQLARLHGGSMTVRAAPDGGAVYLLRFPAAARP